MTIDQTDKRQNSFARLAGALFLLGIILHIVGTMLIGQASSNGTVTEIAAKIASGDHEGTFRVGLFLFAGGFPLLLLLSYSLYVVLKPIDKHMAKFALYCRIAEIAIACCVMSFRYAILDLYTGDGYAAAFEPAQLDALKSLIDSARHYGFYIGSLFFGTGSLVFMLVLYRSGYVPKTVAALGVLGGLSALLTSIGMLLFPAYGLTLEYGWLPTLVYEVVVGLWLLVFGLRRSAGAAG